MAKIPTRPLNDRQRREWCQAKIDHPDTTEKDRDLWRQLRDEHPEPETPSGTEQPPLW